MTIHIRFAVPELETWCATTDATTERWGAAGEGVRLALSVLLACGCLADFEALPNVERRGGQLVFKTARHDVLLGAAADPDSTVTVSAVEVRTNGDRG